MNPPLSYRLLKLYTRTGLRIYFRQWQSAHTERIPEQGPFIFVANHQNAFLDALLVVCGIKRNPWFLARGDVFKKDWAVRLLTFLRIKPVYRFRDGHAAMRNNDKIIRECVDILKQGECVLLFGEGSHNEAYTSRPLQRGFAHVAFQYMDQTGKDIAIVPVGFHYEKHEAFRSRVLVQYGEPISAQSVIAGIDDERERFNPLLHTVGASMRSLMLVVPHDEQYPQRLKYLLNNRHPQPDMLQQLEADRKLMKEWNASMSSTSRKRFDWRWINPIAWYGKLVHLPTDLIMQYIVSKKIKDDQFIGSVKVAVGIFLIPIYYLLAILAWYLVTGNPLFTLTFGLSLPLSGLVAYNKP
ncbi:MAG: 1-acyl-sn-glycerol-3-phosphate acyltransferase [Cyclobacteriaceae bacterium]|jgi:1-acyl-sn-glycerol-3-phosphate acyltransferase|nr:1-acyl-sn-glycerol-3-phosphate acyltransferase [Cyclobacteriaceae bacterium]